MWQCRALLDSKTTVKLLLNQWTKIAKVAKIVRIMDHRQSATKIFRLLAYYIMSNQNSIVLFSGNWQAK